MAPAILVLVKANAQRVADFTAAGYTVIEAAKHASRAEALQAAGDKVQVVLTNGRFGLSGAEMDLLPKLELVSTVGTGYEAVDLVKARSRGIAVTHNIDTNAPSVADHAMMLVLATVRQLTQADRFVRAGGWQDHWRVETPIVAGKRLGILGMGKIGARIAQRASGFEMPVGYHNRNAVAGSPHRHFASLVALAEWCDVLVAATPGGPATRHLINADVLAALGPKGYLVNVGRGTVVDTPALIQALKDKRLAGAGLDVIEGEPALPPELLQCDNVTLTPHCAGRAPESHTAATIALLATFKAHFAGQPLPTAISLE